LHTVSKQAQPLPFLFCKCKHQFVIWYKGCVLVGWWWWRWWLIADKGSICLNLALREYKSWFRLFIIAGGYFCTHHKYQIALERTSWETDGNGTEPQGVDSIWFLCLARVNVHNLKGIRSFVCDRLAKVISWKQARGHNSAT
jgi:hypothetical protein